MKSDASAIKSTDVLDTIIVAYFGIAVGWGWTMFSSAQCNLNISPICPNDLTVSSFLYYLLVHCIECAVCITAFHAFMEHQRLFSRGFQVLCIEDGNAKRLFKSIDEDGDGRISKEELMNF